MTDARNKELWQSYLGRYSFFDQRTDGMPVMGKKDPNGQKEAADNAPSIEAERQ